MPRAVNTEMQRRSAVARFLGCEPEEVERLHEQDGLPAVKFPGKNKMRLKFFLPDLHQWLLAGAKKCPSPKLQDYQEFKRAFFEAQTAGVASSVE